MKPIISTMLLIFLFQISLYAQNGMSNSGNNKTPAEYPDKIRDILTMQDRRLPFESKLIGLLDDSSATVREKALLCFANLQDTNAIPLLVDRINNEAAVFAIGQTGGLLSMKNRASLEHDLIWERFDRITDVKVQNRLIEEIGKFGTEQALIDLYQRFSGDDKKDFQTGFTMSIARFAIRGVVTDDATRYVVNLVRDIDKAPWQAVYALQRIGKHPVIDVNIQIIQPLFRHSDPLVRMYFATLLGKLKDPTVAIEPLGKLAEFDPDWRVQVTAIKALGNFDLRNQDQVIAGFNKLLFNDNLYIPIITIQTVGNLALQQNDSPDMKKLFDFLKRFSLNDGHGYVWQVQVEASLALAKLIGREAVQYINLKDVENKQAEGRLLTALGTTGSEDALNILISYVDKNDPLSSRSALEGLQELVRANPRNQVIITKTIDAAIRGLSSGDVAIVTTGASILGDSLCAKQSSIDPLLDVMEKLRVPDDIEAIQEVCASLGKLKDRRAVQSLEKILNQPDRSVKLAALDALKSITGKVYTTDMRVEPLYTDFDFRYLELFPGHIQLKMETARGDVIMELNQDAAPFTILSFLKLVQQRGFYRGRTFHRIVPNFVVQGGDPRGDGWGGPGHTLRSEISMLHYDEGTIGMASSGKDTEGSQFFITQSPQPHLDGRYTIIGKVISGMDVVNKLQVDDRIYDIKIMQ
ncbi:MAG: peptidylprolyl isomerase [Bacteroidota bacterium]